jgi:hypothetical protein
MSIPQATVEKIFVRCARRCCVCRRFRPLLLQVHHIKEQSEGGTDDEDNLIPTCISCHATVHTDTKLTRRFTERELRQHRDEVYRLVADGKLLEVSEHDDRIEQLTARLAGFLDTVTASSSPTSITLYPLAAEILIAAASSGFSQINLVQYDGGLAVLAGAKQFLFQNDGRKTAELRQAARQLIAFGLVEGDGEVRTVTVEGFQLADNLLSLATSQPESHVSTDAASQDDSLDEFLGPA